MKESPRDIVRSSIKYYRTATNQLRVMPNFIIIGAQRGGTTSLYSYLIQHPNIASAARKEVHFFDNNFQHGVSWYRAHFPSYLNKFVARSIQRADFITGEASPYYLFHHHVPRRVAELLPDVKIITLLRNPVARAYSQYCHEVELGHETLTFEEAIKRENERTLAEGEKIASQEYYYSFNHQHYTYLARGIYVDQLVRWMSFFPREQILLIRSEDFYADPAAIYKKVLMFLGVPAIEPRGLKQGYQQYNKSKDSIVPPKMDPLLRKRLVAYFEPHNDRLYKFLGYDLGWDR